MFSQPLDRDKPLWELWLAEGLEGGRFALLAKTHHALVDGVSGVDLVTVLFDSSPEPAAPAGPRPRLAAPPPPLRGPAAGRGAGGARHRSPRGPAHGPGAAADAARRGRAGCATAPWPPAPWPGPGSSPPRPAPTTAPISPHRRFTWVRASLDDFKAIKDELGGTVNDVVVATVAGALGRHLRRRGIRTDDIELQALIPLSVQDAEDGGSRVEAVHAPLPVWCQDPVDRLELVHEELKDLKERRRRAWAPR